MNILHVISGGETGGSKNHLISLSESLVKKDNKNIIACFLEGTLLNESREKCLDIRLIKQKNRIDFSIINKLYDICVNESIDIINCHGGRANFVGTALKKKYKAKYVTTIHSDYLNDYKGNVYKSIVYSNINKYVLKKFDAYITVSDDFKEMLIGRGFNKTKIYVVYNGIDFTKNKKIATRQDIIEKYDLNNTHHFVSMVARLHPIKGHKVFLDACAKTLKRFNDVTFLIIGSGKIEDELRKYVENLGISQNVYFAGFKDPDDFYCVSDFTVLTSFSESFPLSILESASYRKSVISTDVGGINKLIEDNINGFLIKPSDSDMLSDRMLELLSDTDKSKNFGLKLFEKAKANYSINIMSNKYMEIYKRILNEGDKNE